MTDETEESGARPQGRPRRGEREFGRNHLIESTRGAMRARPKIEMQRREIAEHAGITPALVSYYFPDKALLLEAAARPVIEAYIEDVRRILHSRATAQNRLRRLISLFLTFNNEQGFILEYYLETISDKQVEVEKENLHLVKRQLQEFFSELISLKVVKGNDPRIFPAALWGLCRSIGRRAESDVFLIDEFDMPPRELVDKVLAIISP